MLPLTRTPVLVTVSSMLGPHTNAKAVLSDLDTNAPPRMHPTRSPKASPVRGRRRAEHKDPKVTELDGFY
eukprot:COSAG01_NODE_10267_length_2205_cov_4.059354_3_plen_70_part_00